MKDGELYVSPLTFEDVKEYSKINYCAKFCTDDRETKRADTTKGLVGHVYEVGRITKTYISHRKLKGFEMLKLAPWLNLTNNDPTGPPSCWGTSPMEAGTVLGADADPPFALIFFLPPVSSRTMHIVKD
ncbi:hypothetical protein DSO57_1028801 [Entomophthora muscae]|uniref:Uncharacterized protein n=1 Tax=Entomophthora muscae TaxID=34485 RepID=A0ACC2RG32_9FUNG|nr:hypothetical protein DSO57_1028801 [Entomophthora muscae]